MTADLLTQICHLATRLQSAAMQHAARARDMYTHSLTAPIRHDDVLTHTASAKALGDLAQKLAFSVGQLQAGFAAEVRQPRLPAADTINLTRRFARSDEPLVLDLADSEGGTHD